MCLWRRCRTKPIGRSELAEYLREPIKHYGWDPMISAEELERSRLGLVEMLHRAQEMYPRTQHVYIGQYDGVFHDFSEDYLYLTFSIKTALSEKRWNDACSDLLSVLHSYHIEDSRVLYTIIGILEEYIFFPPQNTGLTPGCG